MTDKQYLLSINKNSTENQQEYFAERVSILIIDANIELNKARELALKSLIDNKIK